MIRISIHLDFHIHIYRNDPKSKPHSHKADTNAPKADAPAERQQPTMTFRQLAEAEVERAKTTLSQSTAANYTTASHSLMEFMQGDQPLSHLTPDLMMQYERWLRQKGICLNTISCYLRSLRSMLRHGANGVLTDIETLFQQVFTGTTRTQKRSIDCRQLTRLQQLDLPADSFLTLARDVFLFCFYAMGMPFVDVAHLRRDQLSDGQLVYYRKKTGQRVTVAIEKPMRDIIRRYARNNSPYVFPLLTPGQENAYPSLLTHYNRALQKLTTMAKLPRRLTSYVPRHTWASTAYAQNVDLPVISQALGHTNPKTTLIYIRELDDSRLQQANHRILQRLRT